MFLEKNYIIINSLISNEENYDIMYFINKCLKLNIPLNKAIIYSKYYENYKCLFYIFKFLNKILLYLY